MIKKVSFVKTKRICNTENCLVFSQKNHQDISSNFIHNLSDFSLVSAWSMYHPFCGNIKMWEKIIKVNSRNVGKLKDEDIVWGICSDDAICTKAKQEIKTTLKLCLRIRMKELMLLQRKTNQDFIFGTCWKSHAAPLVPHPGYLIWKSQTEYARKGKRAWHLHAPTGIKEIIIIFADEEYMNYIYTLLIDTE